MNYQGHLKIKRLLFKAQYTKNDNLKKKLVKQALEEIKRGINTSLYEETIDKYKKLDSSIKSDNNWVNRTNEQCGKRLEELELEFNTYKTSSLKEKVRKASVALGEFYYRRGEYQNSLKRFLRIRDYVTTPQHISQMCLLIIKASLELDNFAVISQYLSRARQVCDANDLLLVSKLHVISGLVDLHNGNFKQAARKFLKVDIKIQGKFTEIITCRDIALYGCFLAVCSFNRNELKSKESVETHKQHITTLIDNSSFQSFVEYAPEVKRFAENFYESNYADFLKQLDKLQDLLSYDIHLRQYSDRIYSKIRNKALCQYVKPFTSINLKKMSVAFDIKLKALEEELVKLIQGKEIKGKIDSHKKILYQTQQEPRSRTFNQILDFGKKYVKDTENAILRMNMLKYKDFAVEPLKKKGGKHSQQMMEMM